MSATNNIMKKTVPQRDCETLAHARPVAADSLAMRLAHTLSSA